ncbi:hypothetical protein PLICRDRAFT_170140 [Plicaturopsis crispa FD-325 SS-3]|nr:hypothetical protein PLICRDRAFT_170140 [Plicaturopsis crispa FD-325 SS-3]
MTTSIPQSPVFPGSPTKHSHAHKPNPHPYAIKTTSTGILSRSNSSGHTPQAARYHYVPPSPSRSRSPTLNRGQGHRYSKSLSSELPSPLPAPPGFPSTSPTRSESGSVTDDLSTPSYRRTKRADTLPSNGTAPAPNALEDLELPSNPKLWTPSQLASYLTTALRVRGSGGDSAAVLPLRVAKDVAVSVRESGIGGKAFLRLNESDLERMGVNQLWRTALLNASRNLRQNVLRGRIWGIGSPSDPSTPDSATQEHLFSNDSYNSSTDSLDLPLSLSSNAHTSATVPSRRGHILEGSSSGRVRGMVQSFERSSSFSSADYATALDSEEEPELVRHQQDEPSIESLLEQEPDQGEESWGARAWLADAPGVTVKRISPNPDDAGIRTAKRLGNGSGSSGSGGSSGSAFGSAVLRGRKGGKAKGTEDRRTVTAIFSGSRDEVTTAPEPLAPNAQLEADLPDLPTALSPSPDDLSELASELTHSRSLLESFRQRLEDVEQKVASMESAKLQAEQRQHDLKREREQRTSDERSGGSSLLSWALSYVYPSIVSTPPPDLPNATDSHHRRQRENGRLLEPTTVSALPSYVLLVGLGLCAVVLKVVLKRMVGRSVRR